MGCQSPSRVRKVSVQHEERAIGFAQEGWTKSNYILPLEELGFSLSIRGIKNMEKEKTGMNPLVLG